MRKTSISRVIMLVAGFIAASTILLGPSFSQVKIEKKADKETVILPAPSEAIPGSAVTIGEPAIPVLTEIEEQAPKRVSSVIRPQQVTRYLKVLFRTLIAPNAP